MSDAHGRGQVRPGGEAGTANELLLRDGTNFGGYAHEPCAWIMRIPGNRDGAYDGRRADSR
jgi:hypothetical protein